MKRCIPGPLLNSLLLTFPSLYQTPLVNFESNLDADGLEDLRECLEKVAQLPGDVVELGSSRCGTAIHLARWLRERGIAKVVYACDSFEGFDRQELAKEQTAKLTTLTDDAHTSTSFEYVSKKLRALGFAETVKPVKGYFRETLPTLGGPFCLALIDCDLQESMTYCAAWAFEKLVPGGLIAFDDYGSKSLQGAKLAVDEFVEKFKGRISDSGLGRRLYRVRKNS